MFHTLIRRNTYFQTCNFKTCCHIYAFNWHVQHQCCDKNNEKNEGI